MLSKCLAPKVHTVSTYDGLALRYMQYLLSDDLALWSAGFVSTADSLAGAWRGAKMWEGDKLSRQGRGPQVVTQLCSLLHRAALGQGLVSPSWWSTFIHKRKPFEVAALPTAQPRVKTIQKLSCCEPSITYLRASLQGGD